MSEFGRLVQQIKRDQVERFEVMYIPSGMRFVNPVILDVNKEVYAFKYAERFTNSRTAFLVGLAKNLGSSSIIAAPTEGEFRVRLDFYGVDKSVSTLMIGTGGKSCKVQVGSGPMVSGDLHGPLYLWLLKWLNAKFSD